MQEHGIPCKYLEAFGSEEEAKGQKAEYSLIDHLKQGKVDLFINLPSRNRFRRPQQHISRGYRARRTAVDHAIPLITNVKNAKILIEGLARYPVLEISSVDAKSSHRSVILPSFVDSAAFVPGLSATDAGALAATTAAALRAGFTTLQVLPVYLGGRVDNGDDFDAICDLAASKMHCDVAFTAAATSTNAADLTEISSLARSLAVPFNDLARDVNTVGAIAKHFTSWPSDKPILTDAKTTDLASVLLLASLHGRSLHIVDVSSATDIELIALSKQRGLAVTADVSIYSLFFTRDDYPSATFLPSVIDQDALWAHLDVVDTFSIGTLPYQLSTALGAPFTPGDGYEEGVQLLLQAVDQGRLTMEDVTARLSDNPRTVFGLPKASTDTYLEVELGRESKFGRPGSWSPLAGKVVPGAVHRVVLRGRTVVLDGSATSAPGFGLDVSQDSAPQPRPEAKKSARFSLSMPQRPLLGINPKVVPPSESTIRSPTQPGRSPKLGSATSPRLTAVDSSANLLSLTALAQPMSARPSDDALQPSFFPPPMTPLPAPTLIENHPAFFRKHILTVRQFSRTDLHVLFNLAQEMRIQVERNGGLDILKGRVLCTMFFEPSTRTSSSFEAAMNRLGGRVVSTTADRSSVTKGESLADTVRTLGCYGDAIVLRHPAAGSAQTAAKFSPVPIINAGDGVGEHPTQVSRSRRLTRDGIDADEDHVRPSSTRSPFEKSSGRSTA